MSFCTANENKRVLNELTSEYQNDRLKAVVPSGCVYSHVVFLFCLVQESRDCMSSFEHCTNDQNQYIQNNGERGLSTFH